jgi:hypothetical protein
MRAEVHQESVAEKLVRADEWIPSAPRFAVSVTRVGIAGEQRLHEAGALVDETEGLDLASQQSRNCPSFPILPDVAPSDLFRFSDLKESRGNTFSDY